MRSVPAVRVIEIDVLRGVALLGILIMNIQAFALPIAAYFNPLAYGGFEGLDRLAWFTSRTFFDVKFLNIFSMLFGASLVLAGKGGQAKRRLTWLLVFGILHGCLLFVGDILFTYGVVGLLLLPAQGWSVRKQFRTGLLLLLVAPLTMVSLGIAYDWLPGSWRLEILKTLTDRDVGHELTIFRSTYLNQLPYRAELSLSNQVWGTLFESGWQSAGCMLLGMAAIRWDFFRKVHQTRRLAAICLLGGLSMTVAGIWVMLQAGFTPRAWLHAQALHLVGSIGVAFGWVHAIVRLSAVPRLKGFSALVGRLGQVAFTAYILQSFFGLWVFGGQGFAQFGQWGRGLLFLVPFLVWLFQLLLANVWTSIFRVGPLEALWRGLYRGDFSLGRVVS